MTILFASIVSLVLALLHFAVYKAIVSIFALSTVWRFVVGMILTVIGLSFVAASALTFYFDNPFTRFYYTVSASAIGFVTYLLIASGLYALVFLIVRLVGADISTAKWFGVLCIVLAVIATAYGLIHARTIVTKDIQVTLPGLPDGWQGKRAVWVSDIHLGAVNGESYAQEVVAKINALNPDIVFIGGDLYDGVKVDEKAIIQPLASLHPALGTYFITGNHEEFRDTSAYLQAVKDIGIHVLDDQMVTINGLQLIGVDDRDSTNAAKFQAILAGLNIDRSKTSILLKHQPLQLDMASKAGISFQISGHTHRAQFFPLNLVTYLIYKGYDYGLHPYDKMLVYTSSGAGTWGPPLRVGSDSEIVVFQFAKEASTGQIPALTPTTSTNK